MPTKPPLAAKIAELRTARGWPQAQLAQISDVSERTVRRIEGGHHEPSLDTLQALAAAFKIDCEELTTLMQEQPKPRARKSIIVEIANGHELLTALAGAHAFAVDADDTHDEEAASLVAALLDSIESAEIYEELPPSTRYEEGRRLSELLDQLRELGWGVCVVREARVLQTVKGPIDNWNTARLCVKNLGQRFENALQDELDELVEKLPKTSGESPPN